METFGVPEEDRAGLVVVDKERGWTSHDVVRRCRRIFEGRRVGHAGSLDPDATGVLLVGVGRATRILRFLVELRKSYEAEIVLGTATTTLDSTGEVTSRWDMSGIDPEEVRKGARMLTGELEQVPPMVSAVRVGGRRLHELARQGIEIDRRSRRVVVHRFEVFATEDPSIYRAQVDCSSGTYVRALAADLGALLGGGAHLRSLRRVSVGSFSLVEASPVGELFSGALLSTAEAMRDYPSLHVNGDILEAVRHGAAFDRHVLGVAGEGPWAVLDPDGGLVGVYQRTGSDRVKPAVVLRPWAS